MEFLELVNAGPVLTVQCSSRSSASVWIGMGRWRNLPAESPALAATFSCENLMRISQTDFFLLSRILPPANIFMVEVVGGRKILEQVPPPPFQSKIHCHYFWYWHCLRSVQHGDDASYLLLLTSLALVKTSAKLRRDGDGSSAGIQLHTAVQCLRHVFGELNSLNLPQTLEILSWGLP